ncbi:MAG: helix-turn-helix domain-containing protein, partial [Bacteroidota bacterium]
IAFEYGFKDPAYFNRFFRSNTGLTPLGFRDQQTHRPEDSFIEDIYELISKHHQQQHQVSFYAEEMNLAAQTLSRKVRERLQTSMGQLIRLQLIKTAKNYLQEGRSVQEISRLLHFEEPNHFSHFFKHYTGTSPTTYSPKKVQ